ncbi:MAG: hypothetical protein MJB14_07505, partial [Spirochaetes bacterium]|nr:hypothetical protein [Spirochaetota bacterium]
MRKKHWFFKLISFGFLFVNIYANELTRIMPDQLSTAVKNQLVTEINNRFNNYLYVPAQKNANGYFKLRESSETQYYFNNNQTKYSSGVDLLTISKVEAKGEHYTYMKCGVGYPGNYGIRYWMEMSISDLGVWSNKYERNSDNWYDRDYLDANALTDHPRDLEKKTNKEWTWQVNQTNDVDPIIFIKPFINESISSSIIRVSYKHDWTRRPGQGAGHKYDRDWSKERQTYYVYKAKDPLVTINSLELDNYYVNGFTNNINVSSENGVKIITLLMYYVNSADNEIYQGSISTNAAYYDYQSGSGQTTPPLNEENTYGISSYDIDINDFNSLITDQGKYRLYVGVLDKFNKIYTYEAVEFLYDTEAPVITGLNVTEKDKMNIADHTILEWSNIADNVDTFEQMQFGYTVFQNAEINIIDKKVYAQDGTTNITDFYIADRAGNKTYLIENEKILI